MKPEEAWQNLKEKFTSGNIIPVDRSTITREEYEAILSSMMEIKNERNK